MKVAERREAHEFTAKGTEIAGEGHRREGAAWPGSGGNEREGHRSVRQLQPLHLRFDFRFSALGLAVRRVLFRIASDNRIM